MFQFDSLGDFAAMSGHGPYVWVSYGVSLAVMVYLTVKPVIVSRQQLQLVKSQSARAQRKDVSTAGTKGESS